MIKNRIKIIAIFLLSVIIPSCILIYEDKNLELNTYKICSEDLPSEFDGFRIVHVSDLHNANFGKDNEKLIDMISEAQPDIIAITGDVVDSRRTDIDISVEFVKQVMKIAPCYYVTGNHEARIGDEYSLLEEKLKKAGVIILDDEVAFIERFGALIEIMGLKDPTFSVSGTTEMEAETVAEKLKSLENSESCFTLLLSHKPEFFDIYVENDIDLVLSGHAHGGQFRFPFLGGIIAPGQGIFPKYDAGLFEKNSTNMIASRGIGNSIIPLRINNRPEIILIELQSV